MKEDGFKNSHNTWKKLMLIGQKQGAIRLKDLAVELNLAEDETLVFLRQVFPPGSGAEIYHEGSDCWVDINAQAIQYMLPLLPSEWIELNQILSTMIPANSTQASLIRKVTDDGPMRALMELLENLENWDREYSKEHEQMISILNQAINEKVMVRFSTKEDKEYLAFPCRLVHLEGNLSLIAEDSKDHCLMMTALEELKQVEMWSSDKTPRVSLYEIDEFIAAVRSMNEKETRLILKINNPQAVNLFPDYQFLGKPCMITNPSGDIIWAAYVEPCDSLYDWLISLGNHVEILDPVQFRQDYLSYYEEKMRKVA